jgi:hypothetical protein
MPAKHEPHFEQKEQEFELMLWQGGMIVVITAEATHGIGVPMPNKADEDAAAPAIAADSKRLKI